MTSQQTDSAQGKLEMLQAVLCSLANNDINAELAVIYWNHQRVTAVILPGVVVDAGKLKLAEEPQP